MVAGVVTATSMVCTYEIPAGPQRQHPASEGPTTPVGQPSFFTLKANGDSGRPQNTEVSGLLLEACQLRPYWLMYPGKFGMVAWHDFWEPWVTWLGTLWWTIKCRNLLAIVHWMIWQYVEFWWSIFTKFELLPIIQEFCMSQNIICFYTIVITCQTLNIRDELRTFGILSACL